MTSILDESEITRLEQHAVNVRRSVVAMLAVAGSGHAAGSLDIVDALVALYGRFLKYNVQNPADTNRDYFLLSAGHLCPALYGTLAEFNLIDKKLLRSLRKLDSPLQGHPERIRLPWLETTSGPLGEGLSQAAGIAYALRYLNAANNRRVYCVMGDGECDEGEVWEAAMLAGKYRLNNLLALVDCNHIQLSGTTDHVMQLEPFGDKWRSFGWEVFSTANGNSMPDVVSVLDRAINDDTVKPKVILLRTVAGYGVDFIQNDYRWHGKAPTHAEAVLALAQLDAAADELAEQK